MAIIFIVSAIITVIITTIIYKTNWKKNKNIPLLPNWIKIISISIIALCILLPDLLHIRGVEPYEEFKNILITISLLLFCFTSDKNENKNYNNKRLLHIFISITVVTITHQTSILLNTDISNNYSPNDLIITALIIYLLTFHYSKKRF